MKKFLVAALIISGLTIVYAAGINTADSAPYEILFLGDTHFGENYGKLDYENIEYDDFFENYSAILEQSDFTVANLETPITYPDYVSNVTEEKMYVHWTDPEKHLGIWKNMGSHW